ncbi:hypothetical protein FHR24_001167 [Wenyingzhuangia heitensis]|uniref:Choice-of-anchor I domain-containing protein n=1 Tax=Wenyingzhuangia heitensis TaxID=1487859 RepID=A0ABX0U7A5_9FLAO|nr:choice-of-anchor I family protein [Wenyingzhuangia heitensis]NIJ44728.1 hypothetical protein [Wenyingzhuangia heitensis]
MNKIFKLFTLGLLGTFTFISCGEDAIDGVNGKDGTNGANGADGNDGKDAEIVKTIAQMTFNKVGTFTNGNDEAFAEISAFDPTTNKLFIVNPEEDEVSVLDLTDVTNPVKGTSISVAPGSPNSVAVLNGTLAVAVENSNKQANGTIETFNTDTQVAIQSYTAGALPDMVAFSPDGKYIISANEGEPNDNYDVDPEGSITIVEIASGTTSQISFAGITNPGNDFRLFGPNSDSLEKDVEPEYVAVSDDSKTAYVSLQENNGLAIVDLATKTITKIVGLGVKDYNISGNEIDASNKDDIAGNLKNWNVLSYYMPDAIDYFTSNGNGYIVSANEGDSRDYDGYSEEERVKDLDLDPTAYPNAEWLQEDENLGRLKVTTANGKNSEGKYEQIYGYGARSFSIWNTNGERVYDSGSEIARKTLTLAPSIFNQDEGKADGRSDDKGAEPESVKTLKIGDETILFVGLERTSAVLVYNVTNALNPEFITWLYDANDISPEGITVVDKADSPTGNYLMIATHEVSSTIAIYEIK